MRLVVQPIPNSPYFDVVDIEPQVKGARVIRAAHCTKEDAELFASAPMMRMQLDSVARGSKMTDLSMVERGADVLSASLGIDGLSPMHRDESVPLFRAALLSALDQEDEALRKVVGDAYRDGMRAFLYNMSGDTIGAINDAMQDAGARAAIAAIRAHAQEETS